MYKKHAFQLSTKNAYMYINLHIMFKYEMRNYMMSC